MMMLGQKSINRCELHDLNLPLSGVCPYCRAASRVPTQGNPSYGPVQTPVDGVGATLAERGKRYGDFTDHAYLAQQLIQTMQGFRPESLPEIGTPWERLKPVQRQALTVIADKIARILSGDPDYADNWHDIQGYAKLVEDRLPKA